MLKTFKIIGRRFATEKKYYNWDTEKRFFYYSPIEEKDLGNFKFKSLEDAELFLLGNYPCYYFGANIIEQDGNGAKKGGDFSMIAVADYYESIYQTSDREKIIGILIEEQLKRE